MSKRCPVTLSINMELYDDFSAVCNLRHQIKSRVIEEKIRNYINESVEYLRAKRALEEKEEID